MWVSSAPLSPYNLFRPTPSSSLTHLSPRPPLFNTHLSLHSSGCLPGSPQRPVLSRHSPTLLHTDPHSHSFPRPPHIPTQLTHPILLQQPSPTSPLPSSVTPHWPSPYPFVHSLLCTPPYTPIPAQVTTTITPTLPQTPNTPPTDPSPSVPLVPPLVLCTSPPHTSISTQLLPIHGVPQTLNTTIPPMGTPTSSAPPMSICPLHHPPHHLSISVHPPAPPQPFPSPKHSPLTALFSLPIPVCPLHHCPTLHLYPCPALPRPPTLPHSPAQSPIPVCPLHTPPHSFPPSLPSSLPHTASPSPDPKHHPTDSPRSPPMPIYPFHPPCPHSPIPAQLLTTTPALSRSPHTTDSATSSIPRYSFVHSPL